MNSHNIDDGPIVSGPSVGRNFEEQLLLALIDAHPDQRKQPNANSRGRRAERLRSAMIAVFATERAQGRPSEVDHDALRWMGQQRCNDRARRTMREEFGIAAAAWAVRDRLSDRGLAEEAAKKFYPGENHHVRERLREKFRTSEAFWVDVAQLHDDVPELQERHALIKVAEILARHGIAMKVKPIPED